eukprot:364715-Chlamydomonas_euryale.AAC.4
MPGLIVRLCTHAWPSMLQLHSHDERWMFIQTVPHRGRPRDGHVTGRSERVHAGPTGRLPDAPPLRVPPPRTCGAPAWPCSAGAHVSGKSTAGQQRNCPARDSLQSACRNCVLGLVFIMPGQAPIPLIACFASHRHTQLAPLPVTLTLTLRAPIANSMSV